MPIVTVQRVLRTLFLHSRELGVIGSSSRAVGSVPGRTEFESALNFQSEDENVLPCRDVQGKRMFNVLNARGQIPLAALV
jgi:hypothetical protein